MVARIPDDGVEESGNLSTQEETFSLGSQKRAIDYELSDESVASDADDELGSVMQNESEDDVQRPARNTAFPFIFLPEAVPELYPFGISAKGTRPAASVTEYLAHEDDERRAMQDLMSESTDEEALEREIINEMKLDELDLEEGARLARETMIELGIPMPNTLSLSSRLRSRTRKSTEDVTTDGREGERNSLNPRDFLSEADLKRIGNSAFQSLALRQPDGVHIKSAAIVEDSDMEED
jgi:hypothetical protein